MAQPGPAHVQEPLGWSMRTALVLENSGRDAEPPPLKGRSEHVCRRDCTVSSGRSPPGGLDEVEPYFLLQALPGRSSSNWIATPGHLVSFRRLACGSSMSHLQLQGKLQGPVRELASPVNPNSGTAQCEREAAKQPRPDAVLTSLPGCRTNIISTGTDSQPSGLPTGPTMAERGLTIGGLPLALMVKEVVQSLVLDP